MLVHGSRLSAVLPSLRANDTLLASERGVAALASSPHLGALEQLHLESNNHTGGPGSLEPLLRSLRWYESPRGNY